MPFHAHFETKFFPLTPQTTVYVHWNEKWSPPQQQQEEQQQRFPLPDLSSAPQIKIGLRFFAATVVGGGEEAPLSVPKGGFTFFKKNVSITSFLREYFNNFFSPVPSDTTFPNVLSACLLLSSLLLVTAVLLEVEFLLLPSGGGGGGDFSFLFAFLRGTDFSGTWDPLKKVKDIL